ncbi:hypothetical protein [Aurantivibrio infirmus]
MTPIAKHTLVSCIVNALFSMAFFSIFFRGEPSLVLGQMSKLTIDFLPQALFVGFFSTLPPSILTIKELRAGKVSPGSGSMLPLPDNLVFRVIVLALLSLIVFGGGTVLILNFVQPITISFTTGVIMKALYGIVLSALITPIAVSAARKQWKTAE